MKTVRKKLLLTQFSLSLCFVLAGCGGSSSTTTVDDTTDTNSSPTTSITFPTSYQADVGRLLGSQCAQCHGTNGVSVNEWDSIAGEDELEHEIYDSHSSIMTAQADGYTSEEITLMGNWLKTLSKNED